jgi:hypothetical protein
MPSSTVQSTHLLNITKDTQYRTIQSTHYIVKYRVHTTVQNTILVHSRHYEGQIRPYPTQVNTKYTLQNHTKHTLHSTIQSTHYTVQYREHTTQYNTDMDE